MDYLTLFNGVARQVKPARSAFRDAANLEDKIADTGLDSLDSVLMAVYLCEIFNIPEEVGKAFNPVTFGDIAAFVQTHATRMPASVEEALAITGT